jgi:hypothetical protein
MVAGDHWTSRIASLAVRQSAQKDRVACDCSSQYPIGMDDQSDAVSMLVSAYTVIGAKNGAL